MTDTETKKPATMKIVKPAAKKPAAKKNSPAVKKLIKKTVEAKVKKDNELTVAEVAVDCGVDPKVARAKLRRAEYKAVDGRWPTMIKGSKEHKELVEFLKPTKKEA